MADKRVPELERVKRIIRALSEKTADRNCTEAEAMAAADKVAQLLKDFDLELTDVFIQQEVCVQRELYATSDHWYGVIGGIARLCSLRHYHDLNQPGAAYVIFGFERDVELAIYLYEVIVEAFGTEWGAYSKINGFARKTREAFELGFGARIRERLISLRAQRDAEAAARAKASGCKDLVVVRDAIVDEEFQKTGVRLVSGKARRIHDRAAFHGGAAAADRVELHTPLNGEAQSLLDD